MLQPRLSVLSSMTVESDLLDKIEFSDIIHSFASQKSRKK